MGMPRAFGTILVVFSVRAMPGGASLSSEIFANPLFCQQSDTLESAGPALPGLVPFLSF